MTSGGKHAVLERVDVRAMLGKLGLRFVEKRGEAWICCPFHREDTPSMHVALEGERKGCWHCFAGCTRGEGSLVALVARVRGMTSRMERDADGGTVLDYGAAWVWLAEVAGVVIDPRETARAGRCEVVTLPRKVPPSSVTLALALPEGCVYAKDSPDALAYLRHRGLMDWQIAKHRLGWWARRRRVIIPAIVRGSLVTWDARAVDLVCPQCPVQQPAVEGKLCSRCGARLKNVEPKTYGARIADGARPDFGIIGYDWLSRDAVVHVTEGPFGAWRLERAGLEAVALRGSRITQEQVDLLAAFSRVVVIPDGDSAGGKLERGLATLAARTEVRVVELLAGAQPDDLDDAALARALSSARAPRYVARASVEIKPMQRKA